MGLNSNSDELDPQIVELIAGRLDAASEARLQSQAAHDLVLARSIEAQREVWAALDLWEASAPGPDFNRRLWAKIEADTHRPWYQRFRTGILAPSWAAFGPWKMTWLRPAVPLGLATVAVFAGFLFDGRAPQAPLSSPAGSGTVTVKDVDQIEKSLDDLQMLRQMDADSATQSL